MGHRLVAFAVAVLLTLVATTMGVEPAGALPDDPPTAFAIWPPTA